MRNWKQSRGNVIPESGEDSAVPQLAETKEIFASAKISFVRLLLVTVPHQPHFAVRFTCHGL